MADVFNNNPGEYIDLNNLFPVLNERVGLTWQQFQALVENVNYVKNNASASGGDVSSVNGQKGDVVLTSADVGAVAKETELEEVEYRKKVSIEPQFDESDNPSVDFVFDSENLHGSLKQIIKILPTGIEVTENNAPKRPTANGKELAYLSDISGAGGGSSTGTVSIPKYTSFVKVDLSKDGSGTLQGLVTLSFVESSNFSIDWGDGSAIETFTEPTTEVTHQYEDVAFKGTIWFYNNWNGFGICDDSVKKTFTNVLYDENIKELPSNTFENCTALASFDYKYMPVSDYARNDYFKIGSYAFANVSRLLGFDFSRAYIDGESAFYNAFYINRLDIKIRGTNINYTSTNIFGGNRRLDYVRFEGRTISRNMFDGSSVKRIEIVPDSSSRVTINSGGLQEVSKSIIIHPTETAPRLSSADTIIAETIMVSSNVLADTKKGTNWVEHAYKIYPYGGQYSETVILPVSGWLNKQQTVEVIGSTPEQRNVIEFMLVDASGTAIEDTYGLTATQGVTEMTFACTTVPSEDIYVFVKSTLTNY